MRQAATAASCSAEKAAMMLRGGHAEIVVATRAGAE